MTFDNLDLVDDNYLLVLSPCSCRGNPECDCVDGVQIAGTADLTILLRNIAVAGALCAAFRQGGASCSCDGPNDKDAIRVGYWAIWRGGWFPGCEREVPR